MAPILRIRPCWLALVTSLCIAALPVSAREEGGAPTLAAAEAADFLGQWVLTMESPQGVFDVDLEIREEEGLTVAQLDMPRMGKTTITDIEKSEAGLVLRFDSQFGEQLFEMEMDVAKTEEGLRGELADESGLFQVAFTGVDRETALARDSSDGDRRRRSRRRGFDVTELTLADQKIELRFDTPATTDQAYALVEDPAPGEVVPFIRNRPLKLKTPVDLSFGDTVVKAHNHGPDYPGAYSLWLRSEGEQWYLVFNHLADVWGTQHDPSQDAAQVPLTATKLEEPVEELTAQLVDEENGGVFQLRWGDHQWTSPRFTVE